jgi:hypothetical protein
MTHRTHAVRAEAAAETTPVDAVVAVTEPDQTLASGHAATRPRARSVARGRRTGGVANPFRRTVD